MKQKKSNELLLIISQREKNSIQSKLAFDEFYKRYQKTLHYICLDICKPFGENKKYSMDLCHDVLLIVHDKAEKFNAELYPNEKKLEAGLKAWMSKIALNELRQRNRKSIPTFPVGEWEKTKSIQKKVLDEQSVGEFQENNEDTLKSLRLKFFDDFFAQLPEREVEIFRTFLERKKHTESSELERLNMEYNVSKANYRQIAVRLLKELQKKALDRYNELC